MKQQDIQRRNLKSTFEAERKKVVMYCRRAALKRMTRDVKGDADEVSNEFIHCWKCSSSGADAGCNFSLCSGTEDEKIEIRRNAKCEQEYE